MSSAGDQKGLYTAIQQRSFAPVYLLHGDDEFRKNDALRRLLDAAIDPGTRDFNLDIRRASETNAETVATLLATAPLMADRRAVVIRDVTSLRKDARKTLDEYLERPASSTLVVLIATSGSKVDAALLRACVSVEFDHLDGARLLQWIANRVGELAPGASITDGAATLLQEHVGQDLHQMTLELEKLLLFTDGKIDEAAVAAVVGVRQGETLFDLLRAVLDRNAARALDILPGLIDQPKSSAVVVVMALTAHMLALAFARRRWEARVTGRALQSELFDLLKASGGPMRSEEHTSELQSRFGI